MLAQDFRIGMIEEKISDETSVAARAFDSAHTFYCGLCQPVAPPWYDYPVVASVPADTDKNLLSSYADALRDYQVSVAYISPEVSDPALINYMASNGMLMIGEVTPPDAARSSWVVSIQPNWLAAVEAAWPQLVAGNGGLELPSPITLTDINPDLLSSGKQRLAQQMLDDLLAGKVSTGAQP
jgi:hypothetical protein